MDRLKPLKPLNLDGNLLQNWKSWKQDFNLFMTAAEYDEKPDNVKSSSLLHCIDERAREVYNTFNFYTTADLMKLEKFLEPFKAYLIQEKILHTPGSNLLLTVRKQDSLDDYMTEQRKLSSDCELEGLRKSLSGVVLIIGLNDKNIY